MCINDQNLKKKPHKGMQNKYWMMQNNLMTLNNQKEWLQRDNNMRVWKGKFTTERCMMIDIFKDEQNNQRAECEITTTEWTITSNGHWMTRGMQNE